MKGYPKHIATKQDYENLLNIPEFAKRAKEDLEELAAINDVKITRAVSLVDENDPVSEWVTEKINNPMPLWKAKGFASLKEVTNAVVIAEAKISALESTATKP